MAKGYIPTLVPRVYDPVWLQEELQQIAGFLLYMELDRVNLVPLAVEPLRKREGDVANADGTNWNPGGGAGLYQYLSGSWVKL